LGLKWSQIYFQKFEILTFEGVERRVQLQFMEIKDRCDCLASRLIEKKEVLKIKISALAMFCHFLRPKSNPKGLALEKSNHFDTSSAAQKKTRLGICAGLRPP
jgi:hypothetical protein